MSSGLYRALIWATFPFLLAAVSGSTQAQEVLPEIVVQAQRPAPPRTAPVAAQPSSPVASANSKLDEARDGLSPRFGASSFDLNRAAIESLPQGINTPIQKVLIQAPGVSQDSAAAGDIHVRNEHGNVQYRINGILLPDGVSGFSQIIETSFIGSMRLITGALPAQYGLHTSGIIDITSKSGAALAGGSVSLYGSRRQTISPSFEYGGVEGNTEYYATGRYLSTGLGLESATAGLNAIHDYSQQGRL